MPTIRPFYKADIEQVYLIEESVHIAPWSRETFLTCFESGYHGWVVELEGKIIGFIIVSMHVGECHVLNICIKHAYQRQGIGRRLMTYALDEARRAGMGIAYLEVRSTNARAIALYRKLQFHLIGTRKDYYPTVAGREDALVFAKSIVVDVDQNNATS